MQYFDGILVLIAILFILISLYREWIGPSFTFIIAVVFLGAFGVLTPKEMLSGFANEQIAVILLLLLLGDTVRKTGVLENFFNRIFKEAQTYNGFLWRMMLLVSSFSAFLNNTPLVAILMPYVHTWSKRHSIAPSKLMIPLSYAAILGGCATLIGTSTNLIVNGLVVDQTRVPKLEELQMFDFFAVGGPMILIGIIFMMLIGKHLLPNRKDVITDFSRKRREYLVEVQIRPGSKLTNKTIEEAELRNLKGLFLVEIHRNNHRLTAVSPGTVLKENDILIFAGDTDTIVDMINADTGLKLTQVGMFSKKAHTEVREVVISHNSTLIGKTIKETYFRGKYDAAIIAVHRNGERMSGKIGTVKLQAGDVLLLMTGGDFPERARDTMDFYSISKVRDFNKLAPWKVAVLLGGTALIILLSALGVIKLFIGLIILISTITLLGIANPKDLPKSLDYNLAVIIALALAIGTAMIKSGVAEMIAMFFINVLKPLGIYGLLFGIYGVTAILAAYITNKAAVAIIFPIAITIAADLGINPVPFVLLVSFAAAANFITPIGYQTNLMVYGPGGYNFKDYMRVGLPLTIIYMFATVVGLGLTYNLF
ncbi:MAG: SLC13 family permease [Bacteroidales bacterium]|nr:SLC13 family permease [Bacteroidales bacterium]